MIAPVVKKIAHFALAAICWCGCQSRPGGETVSSVTTPAELGAAQARASERNLPLCVLVAEAGASRWDDQARTALESGGTRDGAGAALALMDLNVSRARATAARFHPLETPLFICLSPRGVIVSRDQKPITRGLILRRVRQAAEQSPELDAKLAALKESADKNKNDPAAQWALADFFARQQNALEAIPLLEPIAHSETAETPLRLRAWVALGRAHLWIAEPEKARHEAEAMMDTLGARTPEARAGGELVLGIGDANLKRAALARQEFEEAISAAPDSAYGKQAAEAMAGLPR
ncbi:MAG TPA: hypothetical protein VGO59_19990 [Verrucomicrobiae bacterium]